jgi:hypothetical protein
MNTGYVRRLAGHQNKSGHCGEGKIPVLPGIEPQLSSPKPSHYTELSWHEKKLISKQKTHLDDISTFSKALFC